MSAPFIPTAPQEPSSKPPQGDTRTPGLSLAVQLPTEASTIDDKLIFDVARATHEELGNICLQLAKDLAADETATMFVVLDDELRTGLELFRSASVQLDAARRSFDDVKARADKAREWWESEANVAGLAPAAPLAPPPGLDGAATVSSLLALASSTSTIVGRNVPIQNSALHSCLAGALLEALAERQKEGKARGSVVAPGLFGPWGARNTYGGTDRDEKFKIFPGEFQDRANEALTSRAAADSAVDRFVRMVALEPDGSDRKAVGTRVADRLQDDFAAADALLKDLNSLPAKGGASSMLRAATLWEAIRICSGTRFIAVAVEVSGGAYRIVRNLGNLLAGGDGIEYSAGAVLSYSVHTVDGKLVAAGLRAAQRDFTKVSKSNPGQTWLAVFLVVLMTLFAPVVIGMLYSFVSRVLPPIR
jgi:hypothetical protein